MKSELIPEERFFHMHEWLKKNNATIIRCVQIENRNGKFFKLFWLEK